MKHGRVDYNERIQDTAGLIGEDEPVMLFRAKDALAPEVLEMYAALIQQRCDDPVMVAAVKEQAQAMRAWQKEHGKQFPDVPFVAVDWDDPQLQELDLNPAATLEQAASARASMQLEDDLQVIQHESGTNLFGAEDVRGGAEEVTAEQAESEGHDETAADEEPGPIPPIVPERDFEWGGETEDEPSEDEVAEGDEEVSGA